MRRADLRLGRVLRNQLFADAIVVKSSSAARSSASEEGASIDDHVRTAQRLSSALARHRETRRQRQGSGLASRAPMTSPSATVFGTATTKAPIVDVMASVGKSTMLVEQDPFFSHAVYEAADHDGRLARRRWPRQPLTSYPSSPSLSAMTPPRSHDTRSATRTYHEERPDDAHLREENDGREEDVIDEDVGSEDMVRMALESVSNMAVPEVLACTNALWDSTAAPGRLRWLLATPLGCKLARVYLEAPSESSAEREGDPTAAAPTVVDAMMRRYEGLGLRSRAVTSPARRRQRWPMPLTGSARRGGAAAYMADAVALEGLYPSRNSSGSATPSHEYANLRYLFAERIRPSSHPQQPWLADPRHASCLVNPTLAGCTAPSPNTTFVAHKVRAALSNQRKSLWKQQVRKMFSGDGAATFMGTLKSLQQPSGEFTQAPAPTAERAPESVAQVTRVGSAARLARALTASETAAGVSTTSPSQSVAAAAVAGTTTSREVPAFFFSESFLALCAEMGIGSPRYAYVSRALIRKLHPEALDGTVDSDEVERGGRRGDASSSTSRSGNVTWNLAAVRAEAEKLSQEYDVHIAQLQEGRTTEEAAEARRRYDAALLEEDLHMVHNRLIEFRMQLPTLRRLADALST